MRVGGYRVNLDALLARLVYRWRGRALLALLLLAGLAGLRAGLLPPVWRGRAALAIRAAPGATVAVDGRAWPHPLYAGAHAVRAQLPDGRAAWADVTLQAGAALTLTLPPGLPPPRERALPPAAPGTHIEQVWWADGAWRVRSAADPPPADAGADGAPTPAPLPGQTVALRDAGAERLATLDAYAGLADQAHDGGRLIEAVYRPSRDPAYGDRAAGVVEVRGWGAVAQTIPISTPLALLRLAPRGASLLLVEQIAGGAQVALARPGQPRAPLVALPGRVERVTWRPDGRAVVLHSVAGGRLTLALVRLTPAPLAAAVAELDAARAPGGLVPLAWDDGGLLWIAPDAGVAPTLWRAPLTTLVPERRGPLDARAIAVLPDGALRAVTVARGQVTIGRYQGELFIGEAVAPHVPPAADLAGVWEGDQLLLQGGGGVWLIDLGPGQPGDASGPAAGREGGTDGGHAPAH